MGMHVCSALQQTCGFARARWPAVLAVITRMRSTCDVFVNAAARAGVFAIVVLYARVCRRCCIVRQTHKSTK